MNYVTLFKKGRWISKSNSILSDQKKMSGLLAHLTKYMRKDGLKTVKDQLLLLGRYLSAVVHGRYSGYSASSLTLAVAAVLYVVSPLDIIPDFVPAGLVDDVAIIGWAIAKLSDELEEFKRWEST